MGEHPKPDYAYMIPLDENGRFEDDNFHAIGLNIYKIPVDGITIFRKNFPAIKWGVLYSFYDVTALAMFKDLKNEDTGKRKK